MKKEKVLNFLKKYGYYCIAGALIVAIGLTVLLATKNAGNASITPDDNVVGVDTKPISFELPMKDASLLKGFSDTEIQYNKTLNQWEAHKSCDLVASDLSVFAVESGTITAVENNFAFGTIVTINHRDGFVTTYASLADNVPVKKGDTVTKGQKIGEASDTAENESSEGKHLHFEMFKNGNKIDPSNYISFGK